MSVVAVQMNIRVDEAVVDELDGWAIVRGISRPELIRHVLEAWLRRQRREQIEEEYRRAYSEHPERDADLARATEAARRLTAQEPWEPWW